MSDPVARVTLTLLQIPFKEPYRDPDGTRTLKDAILVGVETRDGLVGYGECSPTPEGIGHANDAPGACWDHLAQRIVPSLLGQAVESVEDIDRLSSGWHPGHASAISGAETACWDLLGKLRHEILATLLGAPGERIESGVESGLSVGLYPTVVDLLTAIEPHLAEGYRRLKLMIQPGRDVEFVQAVRQHYGEDLPLMVDARGAYPRGREDVFRRLDEFALLMYEQPMAADDLAGLAALQAAVTTPICLDETADSLERTERAIDLGAGRIVSLRLQRVGGFGPCRRLHDLCLARGVACWVGSTPELGVGRAHGLHLATLPNCKYPTDIEPSARWFVDDYVVPPIEHFSPGLITLPDGPGLGFLVDPVKVRRYQVRHEEFSGT
jgi:O-succinylbenzoate synthase